MKKQLSMLMLLAALLVPWASRAQETVTIGTGTSTSYYIPFNSLYGYSFTEEVYPASAINVAGSITKVRFHLGQSNTAAQTNSITLYMKNVTRSSFSSTTDIEPVTAGDIVYSGSWTIPANYTGWVEIELDNPFVYDGTSNLMVAMHEYTSGYSSRYFSYTSATNSGLSYYSDSSNPDPYNLGSYSGSKYLRSYLANMQIEITQGNISCYGVRNLTASNITAEGMTLSWLDTSNTGATYTVYRVTATDTLVVQSGITDTFYAVTNLEGNTAYTFGVKADCGSGDESSMRYVNARTACVAISSLPFSYGFEDAATGTAAEFPACWHRINDATSTYNYYPYVNNSTSYVHTGVNGLYWYHTTTSTYANNEYAILPPVDLDVYSMSNLTLAFWAKTTSTSYHPQPIIGVMTDPTDATTFTAVDTFSATAITTAWQLFAVSLEDYAGTGNYIAIKWPRPSSTSYMAIDDIYLTDDWCDIPGSVTAHSTAETVTLTWNANGGTSFTAFLGGDTVTNITDTFYTFSNLTPDSVYTYGVANECSSAISAFIEGSIRTQCLAISTFPWMQDFDAITSINDLNCWERFSGLYNDSASFTLTPTTSGWIMYSDHGMAGSQHMKVNIYSTSCQYWLMSPVFEISSGMELSFEYSLTTYASDNPIDADVTDDRFVVFAVTSDGTYVPLGKWGNDTTRDDYSYENIPNVATGFSTSLDQFTGENVRFAFYGESTVSGDDNDLHIDNVYVGAAATCPRTTSVWVSSVNPNGATINWEDTAHVGSYVVEYMPQGSTGTPLTETVTDTTVTLTGLTPNTTYEVNVRVSCGDLSLPRTVFFRTLCSYLDSLPYFENFDGVAGATSTSVAVNNLPPCWSNYNVGTSTSYSGYPIVYNSSTYAHSGAQAMRFYNYITAGTYADQYGIMPMTDSTEYPINALRVNFWMRANTTSYNSWVVVGVMTNPSDASTFVPVQTIYTNSSTTYANHNVNFGSYTGAHGCVAFKFPQPTSGYNYGYVDDVTLEVAPTCAPVVSHNVTATASAARITWDYDHDFAHGADSYEVSYGYASDNLVGATTVTVTDPIVVLTALDADTTYKVSIQPICTDGTAAAHVFNFNTAALPCAEWDTTGYGGPTDTLVVGTPGTSTTNVMPVNTAENYSYCQHLILASHIAVTGPTTFSGIAFDYAASTPMTHANNCQIYMGNTTRANFNVTSGSSTDSMFVPYSQLTLVYQGPLNCTASGYNYFDFNQGAFAYDGTSNIVVAIVNNSGASNSSAIFRYEQTSGAAMTHRVANSTTPYGPAQMDAARANQSYWRTNMKLLTGGGACISVASCYAPSVSVEPDSVGDLEVNWLPGYQESSWDLDYKAEGDSTWTNVLTGTSLTSYTISMSALQANTQYSFRVTANCTDTTLAGTASFTTPCSYISIPYNYGFEDMSTGSSSVRPNIPCWHHLNNATSYYGYPYVSSTTPHGGSRNLYWYLTTTTGTYGDYEVVVLPPVQPSVNPVNSLQLSFWARPSSTSYSPVFLVGVMTNPEDISTFQTVATVNVNHATTNWDIYEVPLSSYTGNGQYVAIRANRPGSAWYAYLDDVTLENIPLCPRVENVGATNITDSSVTVYWDTTSATDYDVQYGVTGFAVGTGTSVHVTGVDSLDITGLTPNTAYDVYVRGNCALDSGTWSYCYTFRTACVAYAVPYTEDFETYSSGSSYPISACWTKGTNSSTAYPYPYSSNAVTGQRSLYFYAYHPSSTSSTAIYSYAALPQFQEPINNLQMDFKVRTYSSSGNNYTTYLLVGVMSNPNDINTFTAVDTVNLFGEATSSVHDVSVSFANYTGSGLHIAIYDPVSPLFGSATYNYSYAYVDDITVDVLPLCPRVENLMAATVMLDSALIVWNDTSSTNTAWNIEFDTVPFVPGTGHMTPIHVTDSSYMLTGLDSGTVYHVYVYPDCGTNVYYRHISFTTLAASPATLPFFCDFEGAGLNGWDLFNGNQTNYWTVGSGTGNPGSSLYVTNDGTTNSYTNSSISYAYAVRAIRISDTGVYTYSFDWKCQGEGNYDFIRVFLVPASINVEGGVLPFGTSAYNFGQSVAPSPYIDLADRTTTPYGLNQQSTWQTHVGTTSISTPGVYKLIFAWANDGSGGSTPPGAVDNVGFSLNTCPAVTNITVTNVTDVSATVQWTAGGSETEWIVTVGNSTSIVNTPSMSLTGLSASTSYSVMIRPICSVGDTGFAATEMFNTEMCGSPEIVATGDPDSTSSTTYYTPLNNFYNYTLTETIIDSAEIGGPMEFSAISYYYNYSSPSTVKTDVDIYIQPTNKTAFTSSSDIVPLSTDAVLVYHGPLNCTQGWNTFAFNTPYSYSGNGNLMVIVDDNSGDYDGNSYTFKSMATSAYKTIVYYSDSYDPDVTSISSSYSGTKAYYQYRAVMQLVSCGGCSAPPVTVSAVTYESATITASSVGESFELEYGIGALDNTMTSTTGAFNLTGLSPATQYVYRVRQNCGDNEMSNWTEGTFTTDSLPCMAVTNLEVTELGYTSLSMSWTAVGDETAWEVNVFSTIEDTTVLVETESATVGGLVSERLYNITVRPMCGSNHNIEGPWCDTIQATTAACLPVENVTVAPNATYATVSWTAPAGATNFRVLYGEHDFSVGSEMGTYNTSDNPFVLTELEPQTPYTVRVANACTESLVSSYASADFETTNVGIDGVDMSGAVSLFPNPASTMVTLRVSEQMVGSTVSIVDVNGRVVYTQAIKQSDNQTITIDLNDMAKGAYFVRLTGEKTTVVRKLIVE